MRQVLEAERYAKRRDWMHAFEASNAALRLNAAMLGVVLQVASQIMDGMEDVRRTYSMSAVLGQLRKDGGGNGPGS